MEKKLTVICVCYNQEKFIVQALEGFLAQKTNFSFEVIVADDASTDSTQAIIRDYASRHPDVIRPFLREVNVGVWENLISAFEQVETPFVAWCDGDDYWTDTGKLQKQVDFLETHPECSVCFHPVDMKWEDGSYPDSVTPTKEQRFGKTLLTLGDLLKHNFIQPNSVVYRWRFSREDSIRDKIPKDIIAADYCIHLLNAEAGKIGFIDEVMAVYRRGISSAWAATGFGSNAFYQRYGLEYLTLYHALEKRYHRSYADELHHTARRTLQVLLAAHDWGQLAAFSKQHAETLDAAIAELCNDNSKKEQIEKVKRKFRRKIAILTVLLAITLLLLLCLVAGRVL